MLQFKIINLVTSPIPGSNCGLMREGFGYTKIWDINRCSDLSGNYKWEVHYWKGLDVWSVSSDNYYLNATEILRND